MKKNITYEEAISLLAKSNVKLMGEERLFLHDCLGRILAKDVCASEDMPLVDTAAMDGYACHRADVESGIALKILGDNPAGNRVIPTCARGCCIKTFTGSKMPHGADMLVIVEEAREVDGELQILKSPPSTGLFIRKKGDNYRAGEILLKAGTLITPAEIGLLASLNRVFVDVRKRPVVTILSGGDELVELGECRGDSLRSVNNHLLKAAVESLGGVARLTEILPDEPGEIRRALKSALDSSDIVLTTGGMSMGDYDFTQEAIYDLCDVEFHGVRVKPGKPIAYAKRGNTHLFGLPGFPNSCLITFYLFGRIILNKMLGISSDLIKIHARLNEALKKEAGRAEFRTCTLHLKDGEWSVDFVGKKGIQSSIINNLCGASALVFLDSECTSKESGETVEVVLLKPLETIL